MPPPSKTDPGPDDSVSTPDGPGEGPMSPNWIVLVAVYLVFTSGLVLYGLIKLWPYPTPSGETKVEAKVDTNAAAQSAVTPAAPAATSPQPAPTAPKKELPDPETIYFFSGRLSAVIYLETRLLLLVMLSGALGSLMHSLRSLYWYTGNRMMVWSWVGFYVLLPVTGAMLAVIFYFVVRGGFFSPQASFDQTSPFGFAALSALVGLFSPQATLKLKEIAETIFTKPGAGTDTKPQEALPKSTDTASVQSTPTISSVTNSSGSTGDSVKVAGTGFASGVIVKFGGLPGNVTAVTDTSIDVVIPAPTAGAGPVDVEITNADGGKATLSQGFTYLAEEGEEGEEGEGGGAG